MVRAVVLTNPIFTDLEAARKHFEAIRWPNGPYCPFCGVVDRVVPLGGASMGPGWYHCKDCRKKFTAAVGTIYERSHIPMTKWMLATHLICASKKGMCAHQLSRMLGLRTRRHGLCLCASVRECAIQGLGPTGGEGKTVEADETYIGGRKRTSMPANAAGRLAAWAKRSRSRWSSAAVRSARSHHVPDVSAATLRPILVAHIDAKSFVTDDAGQYRLYERGFPGARDRQSRDWRVRARRGAHSNTVESYFAILKRGITGIYHHVSQQHLKRYLAEFDFRYNERVALDVTDAERATKAVKGVVGKRVTYRNPNGGQTEGASA